MRGLLAADLDDDLGQLFAQLLQHVVHAALVALHRLNADDRVTMDTHVLHRQQHSSVPSPREHRNGIQAS